MFPYNGLYGADSAGLTRGAAPTGVESNVYDCLIFEKQSDVKKQCSKWPARSEQLSWL